MKICQVAPELLPVPPTKGGAIERWIRDAAVRLTGRGHEVHVIARDHGDGADSSVIDGVRYHFVRIPPAIDSGRLAGLFRGLWYYWHVRRLLRRIAPEIVHHHSRPAGLWLSAPSGLAARYLLSLHSMDYGWGFGHRAWDRRFFPRGFALASRVLCVSNFIERLAVDRYPEIKEMATTFYNGVDGEVFRPAVPRPTGPPTIVYVGRIEQRKGVKELVDAFEQSISQKVPEARLLLVGPHSYWDAQPSGYYRILADRCGLNPRIEMPGPTNQDDELSALYRRATISVVPSVFPEGFPLTSIEAQASGTPVVVSDVGGLPESVSPESGIVFENGNLGQLADAVVSLLQDDARRESMAAGARAWAMAQYSWDVVAARLEGEYVRALAQPAPEAAR
jgi:spore coat protein SA